MTKTADQALHDHFWKVAEGLVGNVYEITPAKDVPYPFITFGEISTENTPTKVSGPLGNIQLTMHVWDAETKRANVSRLINELLKEAYRLESAYGYKASYSGTLTNRIITDATVAPPVMHGVLTVAFHV